MNVLFVINTFGYGGAERLVCDLALHMQGEVDKIVIAGLYTVSTPEGEQMRKALEEKGIKTYVLDKRVHTDRLKSVQKLRRIIKEENISIIHAHCPVPELIGNLAGLSTHIPVVCTVHNTQGYPVLQTRATSWMANAYVAIGKAGEDYMRTKLHIPAKKITLIYNAVDTSRFGHGKKDPNFWKPFGGKEKDIHLVHVGRIHPQKNQLAMLRAMMLLKNNRMNYFKLYIIGPYDENDPLYQEMTAYIKKHNLSGNVKLLGPRANVADFLANADCFVMVSHYEGFSLAFLEAVISGVPIIASKLPFVQNLNKIAPCAIELPLNEPEVLARAICLERFRSITPPSKLFAEKFSLENAVAEHVKLYRRILCR